MKKCNSCFQDKSITEFYISNKSKDGRQSMCKPCYTNYFKMWREQRKAMIPQEIPQSKSCQKCRKEKPISQFNKRSVSKDKKHYLCKDCQRMETREALKRHYSRKREMNA